jgi:membrane protease YdiL (CAAX protease family)
MRQTSHETSPGAVQETPSKPLQQFLVVPLRKAWTRLPLVVRSILTGFLVSSAGITAWSAMLAFIPKPWSILPMIGILWIFWEFFSGRRGPKAGAAFRREQFRPVRLSPAVWKWGLLAAACFVVIVQGSFVLTYRLLPFPAASFTADYKALDRLPLWVAFATIVMGSIVAGICEETGFRGYLQVPLEKKYGAIVSIIVTSLVFTAIHLSHTWARQILPQIFFASVLLGILAYKSGSLIPGIIGHSILDIFDYSVWWTDLTGGFTRQPIFRTGVDLHFVSWTLLVLLALFVFFRAVGWLGRLTRQAVSQAA